MISCVLLFEVTQCDTSYYHGLDYIFIWLGPAPPTTPPSLPGLPHAPYLHLCGKLFLIGSQRENQNYQYFKLTSLSLSAS